jgi:hypothetical protein
VQVADFATRSHFDHMERSPAERNRGSRTSQTAKRIPAGSSTDAAAAKSRNKTLAGSLMLLTTFFWAGNIVAGKMALTGFSALALAQLRMAATALLYWILYVSYRGFPSQRPSGRQWLILGLMAFTGITLNQV